MRHRNKHLTFKTKLAFTALFILMLLIPLGVFLARTPRQTEAAWSGQHSAWTKRKQLNVVNNSAGNLSANTTIAVTIDTQTLFNIGLVQSDCDDLRVLYQSGSTITELTRHLVYPAGTTCATSTATKVNFPIQAALNAAASSTAYYMYYASPDASTPSNTDNAFDIGAVDALLVCPFDGSTTCVAGETPSTETGAIRYGGAKGAIGIQSTTSRVDLGTPTSLNNLAVGQVTYEFWVYKDTNDSAGPDSFWYPIDTPNSYGFNVYFGYGSSGEGVKGVIYAQIDCSNVDAVSSTAYPSATGIVDRTWTHIAYTFDNSGDRKIHIYNNGQEITYGTQTACSGTVVSDATDNKRIGGYQDSGLMYLDEVRFSNVVRYAGNFSPPTAPFTRDEYAKLLLHFDENGDDPRNSGKAVDDSGLGNHGTITGAKYVTGLVGVDKSSTHTGNVPRDTYAGHEGVFIEEGTTNKITNPSFEHGTYSTNWTASASATLSDNTTAPYYKFGSHSAKAVVSGADSSLLISINAGNTNTHTLSAYVYDGTTGNIGGTVSSSIARLMFNATPIATTYTDFGGGWWRLSGSAATVNAAANYGVEIKNTKTIYLDGVQLEEKAYASTYADGTLGTGYGWDTNCDGTADGGTAHNSCTARTKTSLNFSSSEYPTNEGTISFWHKRDAQRTNNQSQWLFRMGSSATNYIGAFYYTGTDLRIEMKQNSVFTTCGNSSSSYDPNEWHFFTIVWKANSAGSDSCQIYLDGAVSGTGDSSKSWTFSPTGNLYLGSDGSNNNQAGATLTDFNIYNKIITSTQVSDLYYAGLVSHSDSPGIDRFGNTNEDPVAIYHFDEGNGSTVLDSSRNTNNLTTYGPTWEVGSESNRSALSRSLKFDGTNDIASSSAALKGFNFGSDSFSVSTWFKHPSTISGTDTLLSQYGSSGYKVYMNSSGYICGGIDDDSTWGPDDSACSTASYADSKWHHAELVKNGTTDLTLYIDGNRVGYDNSISATGSLSTGSPLFLGSDTNNSNYWDGFIDEMYFYGYARTAAEAKQDFLQNQTTQTFGVQSGDPLTNGLVGWWKMDEASWTNNCSANSVNDSSGNNNHGKACPNSTGPTGGAVGKFGNSGNFDGSNDVVTISDADYLTSSAFTISAWVNFTGTSGQDLLMGKGNEYWLSYNFTDGNCAANKIGLTVYNGTSWVCGSIGSTLTNSTWYHLTGVYDGSKIAVYVNGVLDGIPANQTANSNQSLEFGIGSSPANSTVYPFNGKIDEVRVYNRALSPDEVQSFYAWAPGPVAWWKMDEGTGTTTLLDSSGFGNDATFSNMSNQNWMPAKFGTGIDFNNGNVSASRTETTSLDFSGEDSFTITGWVKIIYDDYSPIITQYDETGGTNNGWYLNFNSNFDQFGIGVSADGSTGTVGQFCGDEYAAPINHWYFIAAFYDGPSNIIACSINGGKWGARSDATNLFNSTATINIGKYLSTGKLYGFMDDLKIYNYTRTQAQIVSDMNAGHPAPGSPVGSAIGEWKFDETGGYLARDSSSYGHHLTATLNNRWVVDCKYDRCSSGTSNFRFTLTDDPDLDFAATDSLTTSVWFKHVAISNAEYLIRKENGNEGYALYMDSDGDIVFGIGDTNSVSFPEESIGGNLTKNFDDSVWHQATAVKNSNSSISLYIDGVKIAEDTSLTTDATMENAGDLYLADANNTDGNDEWIGSIDQAVIYRSALSDDQIKVLYNQGKAQSMGVTSTNSSGTPTNSALNSYCPPGYASTCVKPQIELNFDDMDATSASDSSTNFNHGTMSNSPTWISSCISGPCLNFDGVSSYINALSDATVDNVFTSGGTIMTWLYIRSTGGGGIGRIMQKWDGSLTGWIMQTGGQTGTDFWIQYSLFYNPSYIWRTSTSLPINTWFHLAMTYNRDSSSNDPTFYINGKKYSSFESTTGGGTVSSDAGQNLQVGGGTSRAINGYMDRFMMFTDSLTPAQIAWNYNQGAPVIHYKMDDCSGSTLNNSAPTATQSGQIIVSTLYPVSSGNTTVGSCNSGVSTEMWHNGTTGKFNASVDFDGTDDYAASANLGILTDNSLTYSNLSWGGWFKPSTAPVSDALMFKTNEFKLTTDGSGFPECSIYNGSWQTAAADNVAIPTSSWSHLLCTYDGINLKLYVNGVLKKTLAETDTITSSSATALYLALDPIASGDYFDGQIDEVKIWAYDLTAQQVKLDYAGGAAVRFQ